MKANDVQIGGDHYQHEGIEQHWDWTWRNNYDQFEYCVSKYVERYPRKNGVQDLEKALHHLTKYMEVATTSNHRLAWGVRKRIELLECNELQGSVLVYLHTGELSRAQKCLVELLERELEEAGATSAYVNQ